MTVIIGGGEIANAIKKISHNCYIIEHDDLVEMKQSFVKLVEKKGKPDNVIITSGYLNKKFVGDFSSVDIGQQIRANMVVPIDFINLIVRMDLYRTRVVVFSSSVTYAERRSGYSVYAAAKIGLERFIQSCLNGDAPLRIKIIRPSRTDTKLRWDNYEDNDKNRKNILYPHEVAECTLDFLTKDDIVLEIWKKKGNVVCLPKKLKISSI